jgi:hypothetical protein
MLGGATTFIFEQVSKGALAMSMSHNGHDSSHTEHVEETAPAHEEQEMMGGVGKTVATVAVVAVGAALFETALLPGLALGVAAVAAPKYLPRLGAALG